MTSTLRLTLSSLAAGAFAVAACGGSPAIEYYQIALPEKDSGRQGEGILAVEHLVADSAYEDQRIVYRESPYRLNYYHYHRWSSPPGMMVSDYLRMAYEQSGRFREVMSGYTPDATTVLSGRVMALEEVDADEETWLARVRIELHLRDARSGELLWSDTITREEPVETRTPEGLAQALSSALEEIVTRTAPQIAEHTSAIAAARP